MNHYFLRSKQETNMPTPVNGGKETQGEDNNALQLIELRRQLQEKDRAIETLEQEREEEYQRR